MNRLEYLVEYNRRAIIESAISLTHRATDPSTRSIERAVDDIRRACEGLLSLARSKDTAWLAETCEADKCTQ